MRRRAVDEAAAEVAAVVIEGGARFVSIRVPGADGQAAAVTVVVFVAVVEVGSEVPSGDVVAWTAGAEGGTSDVGVHCSVHEGCGDVPVGDCW